MTDIVCVANVRARLGEGPCWDEQAKCLWWVDIHGRAIHRFDPASGEDRCFVMRSPPGSLAVRVHGGLIVAMGDGFMMIDPASSIIETVASPEAHLPDTRMNDGRTDRQGRFWAGSICEVPGEPCRPIGGLYRLDADLTCTKMVGDIAISNGLAWSVDGNIMYHADSITPFVWQWDYDVRNGEIANRKVFLNLSEIGAVADGATIDSEGCYWIALPFKGKVHRYDPAGKLMWSIDMPVDAPTCCEFGGANLDILYVTSATFGRGADALRDQPLAGGLFALDVGVKGVAATRFAG